MAEALTPTQQFMTNLDQIGAESSQALESIAQRNLSEFNDDLDVIFGAADRRLADLGKKIGRVFNRECYINPDTVGMLQAMTDGVLEGAGYTQAEQSKIPVIYFKAKLPPALARGYELEIISIAEGVGGYNTSTSDPNASENRRRWVVFIDRGTSKGRAYDNKGVVYENGYHEPIRGIQNINTGSIGALVRNFHDNHMGPITFEIQPDSKSQSVA